MRIGLFPLRERCAHRLQDKPLLLVLDGHGELHQHGAQPGQVVPLGDGKMLMGAMGLLLLGGWKLLLVGLWEPLLVGSKSLHPPGTASWEVGAA